MDGLQQVYRLADGVNFQSMGPDQQTVILRLGDGQLYTCNQTTTALLERVDGRRNMATIVADLQDFYDVPPDKLAADLLAMAQRLVGEGLLSPCPPRP